VGCIAVSDLIQELVASFSESSYKLERAFCAVTTFDCGRDGAQLGSIYVAAAEPVPPGPLVEVRSASRVVEQRLAVFVPGCMRRID
jgi:hypothetical protein